MLLIALTDAAAARVVRVALDHDALLPVRGPLRDSYVVTGDRNASARASVPGGVLIVAATDAA